MVTGTGTGTVARCAAPLCPRRALFVLASMWALVVVAGCQEKLRCGALERCDVRDRPCQQAALEHAACLRGRGERTDLSYTIVVRDREELIAERVAEAARDETPDARLVRRGLTLLGLARPDATSGSESHAHWENVSAFYEPGEWRITLTDECARGGGAMLTLVHEMVHLLQDVAGEIEREDIPDHLDAQLAASAVIEGEAMLWADEAWAAGYGMSIDELPYGRILSTFRWWSWPGTHSRDPLTELRLRFPYAYGASYLWPLRREEGASAIALAHARPPVSTYAVMEGDPRRPDQRPDVLGDSAVPVLPSMRLVAVRHMGRLGYQAFLRGLAPDGCASMLPSDHGFVADTLSVLAADDETVTSVWRLRFDHDVALAGSPDVGRDHGCELFIGTDATDLWLIASERNETLATLPSRITWGPAPAEDHAPHEKKQRRVACVIPRAHAP